MKHFAAGAMLALFALGLPAQGFAGDVDPASVPEIKRSKLQLYLTPQDAYEIMRKDAAHTLFLDVRTRAEAMYVGMPTMADGLVPYVEHQELMTDWDERRHMYQLMANSDFLPEADSRLKAKGLAKTDPLILICRSGDRSARAANWLAQDGFTRVWSVVDGFEGDMGQDGRRSVNGWKNAGLPWSYQLNREKMYFPRGLADD